MSERTAIAWSRSTFSPWIGCTEVSDGCTACYARELDRRHRYGGAEHWGVGVPRLRTSASYWRQALRWDAWAEEEKATGMVKQRSGVAPWSGPAGFWPVFPSMCDPFDNEVPDEWHADFWKLINSTPYLTWLLLTKRIGNAMKYLPWCRPAPAGVTPLPWDNVWIGASVVNKKEADRDLPKLREVPAVRRFVSHEPALGEITEEDWKPHLAGRLIHQIISGGESNQGKHKGRRFVIGWARSDKRAARAAGVAFFMKQMGAFATNREGIRHPFKDRAGADPAEWPEDLRVQEFPV